MSDPELIKNWAVEGVDAIAAHLGVDPVEAEHMCASREIDAFQMADGRWAILKERLAVYLRQRDTAEER